ncbi:hypothetical protein, partial [Streptomyces goshikiensis]|uniref:hypothetical protein n=1 Tax=Streptomyces goshikiensis TaxID=1942 RepID=UPI0036618D0D
MLPTARADELDTYCDLTLLAYLRVPDDQLPALKNRIGAALRAESGPFSHGLNTRPVRRGPGT